MGKWFADFRLEFVFLELSAAEQDRSSVLGFIHVNTHRLGVLALQGLHRLSITLHLLHRTLIQTTLFLPLLPVLRLHSGAFQEGVAVGHAGGEEVVGGGDLQG